jgi:branched-chain amino acid transport system permease protein
LVDLITRPLDPQNALRLHLLDSVSQMRLLTMGFFLLLMLRFYPRGMIPEK